MSSSGSFRESKAGLLANVFISSSTQGISIDLAPSLTIPHDDFDVNATYELEWFTGLGEPIAITPLIQWGGGIGPFAGIFGCGPDAATVVFNDTAFPTCPFVCG